MAPSQPSHHSVVQKADDIVFQDKYVSRMRVRVEEAVVKHLLEDEVCPAVSDELGVKPLLGQRGELRDFRPLDELHRQDLVSDQLAKHPRHPDGAVRLEVPREALDVSSLDVEIHLLPDRG